MKKQMTVMLSLCLSLLLLLSACASGGSTAKKAEKAAAALAESMLTAPSEPMQRFGSILENGEESALTAYKDAWEDEKALCSENGFGASKERSPKTSTLSKPDFFSISVSFSTLYACSKKCSLLRV